MLSPTRLLVAGLLACLVAASTATAAVVTTFDAGLEGWLVTGDNSMSWGPSNGNPGGCLNVNDLAVGDLNYAVAPAAYLGDWSALGAADSLSADIYLHLISGNPIPQPFVFRLVGPGGAARAPIGASFYPTEGVWTHYAISLSPSDWTLESGTWAGLLASVQTFYITAEYVNGPEDCRIDNVRLSRTPVTRFIPCLASVFNGSGTEDWAFSGTSAIAFSTTGGNAGGYVRASSSGVARAITPPSFRGDWSGLAPNGRFRVDLRVLSSSGAPTGASDFITLMGPGGAARRAISAAELPPVGPLWKTFEIPIEPGSWTMTSGTWAGLLADVEDVQVRLDLHVGSEVIGFDNVARLEPQCGDPDLRINLQATDLTLCDHVSMEGLRGVARDPASGDLFGVIDQAAAAIDQGLWGVTGPQSGVRLQTYDRPAHLVFDPQGNAYVSEDFSGNVYRRAAGGGSSLWVAGLHAGDDDPVGFCIAPAGFDGPMVDPGDILVVDRGNSGPDEVWAFSAAIAEGERLVVPDPGEVDWVDIAAGTGVAYLCDALNPNALTMASPSGALAALALQAPVAGMVSVVSDSAAGTLYVASGAAKSVHRVNIATGAVQTIASGFVELDWGCLEFDAVSRALWITDQGANRVHRLCLAPLVGIAPAGVHAGLAMRISPNPGRDAQRIHFSLPQATRARIAVFDLAGRRIRVLCDRDLQAGPHELIWDGRDERGQEMAPGVFLVHSFGATKSADAKLIRIR